MVMINFDVWSDCDDRPLLLDYLCDDVMTKYKGQYLFMLENNPIFCWC